ncbi:hypothetical protein YC2023_114286 [Brassica napus]
MVHAGGHNSPGSNPNPTHMNKFAFGCAVVASIISIIFGYDTGVMRASASMNPLLGFIGFFKYFLMGP